MGTYNALNDGRYVGFLNEELKGTEFKLEHEQQWPDDFMAIVGTMEVRGKFCFPRFVMSTRRLRARSVTRPVF